MAELLAYISCLTALILFSIEWDEERDGGELSMRIAPYVHMAQKAWHSTVLIFERAKDKDSTRSSSTSEGGDSGLDSRE